MIWILSNSIHSLLPAGKRWSGIQNSLQIANIESEDTFVRSEPPKYFLLFTFYFLLFIFYFCLLLDQRVEPEFFIEKVPTFSKSWRRLNMHFTDSFYKENQNKCTHNNHCLQKMKWRFWIKVCHGTFQKCSLFWHLNTYLCFLLRLGTIFILHKVFFCFFWTPHPLTYIK